MSAHYPDLSKEINDLFETPVMKVQGLYEEVSFIAYGEEGGAVKQKYEDITSATGKFTASIYSNVGEQVKQGVTREIDKLFFEMGKTAVILDQKSAPIDFKTSKIHEVLAEVKDWVKDLSNAFDFTGNKDKFEEFEEKLNENGGEVIDPLFGTGKEDEPVLVPVVDETGEPEPEPAPEPECEPSVPEPAVPEPTVSESATAESNDQSPE